MNRAYLITFILLLGSFCSRGQNMTLKNESEVMALTKKVAHFFTKDSIPAIFKALELYWPISKADLDEMESKTVSLMATIREQYGEPFGNVKVREEKIGGIGFRETYFVQYTKSAVRLKISYYKNTTGWIVHSFTWDDSFAEEFR